MPTGEYNHPLFGLVKFKTKDPTWVYGGEIVFTAGFDASDVTTVTIPQLKTVTGANGGKLKFHKRGQKQLLAVFADIEALGLMKHIKTCQGAFYQRLRKPIPKKGQPKKISKLPSNHSFGIAIDLNADDGSNGGSVAPVAPVFEKHGFKWGKSFNDPMHFEVEIFVDNAKPTVQDVKVVAGDKPADLGAKTIFGKLFLSAKKAKAVPGLKVEAETGDSVSLKGAKGSKKFSKLSFGDTSFISLPQALGVAGLTFDFDNAKKELVAKQPPSG